MPNNYNTVRQKSNAKIVLKHEHTSISIINITRSLNAALLNQSY